jgi:hypothetical protein
MRKVAGRVRATRVPRAFRVTHPPRRSEGKTSRLATKLRYGFSGSRRYRMRTMRMVCPASEQANPIARPTNIARARHCRKLRWGDGKPCRKKIHASGSNGG